MTDQACAMCGAVVPRSTMYLSDRGDICPVCHAKDEAADRAELHSNEIEYHDYSGGDGAAGWAIWIAVLLGINLLSAIFDWGFWLY